VKRFSFHESITEAQHLKNVLEQAGVACVLKNVELSGGLGEIPFLECLPELWIIDEREAARARTLIAEASAEHPGHAWRCAHCGEVNEAQFAACWQCGTVDGPEASAGRV
jgi:Putative prokaryotic signal transducing protein